MAPAKQLTLRLVTSSRVMSLLEFASPHRSPMRRRIAALVAFSRYISSQGSMIRRLITVAMFRTSDGGALPRNDTEPSCRPGLIWRHFLPLTTQ
jgi:hypothetical protein